MSLVLPYTREQIEAWERRAPEPLLLSELPGWQQSQKTGRADGLLPNERLVSLTRGKCRVFLRRFWDRPLTAGGPMAIGSSRPVEVDGRPFELHTTRMFEGREQQVELLFVPGTDSLVRIAFYECGPDEVTQVLGAVRLAV